MDDDLTWATDDLAEARRIYERVRESSEPADGSWERNGFRWRLIARAKDLPDGRPDAYLTASGVRSHWRFSWRGGDWSVASHVERHG